MSEIVVKLSEEDRKTIAEDLAALIEQRDQRSPWMTRQEAIEYSRLPKGTFAEMVQKGRIRARGGKRQLFHRTMLDADLGYIGSES